MRDWLQLAPSSYRQHSHPITIAMLWYRGPEA
jgi:hypothetical protein